MSLPDESLDPNYITHQLMKSNSLGHLLEEPHTRIFLGWRQSALHGRYREESGSGRDRMFPVFSPGER